MKSPYIDARHPDADVIESLGGPTKVAELLGLLSKPGAVQRVWNWTRRGIPPSVRLEHQDLFAVRKPELAEQQEAA